MSEKMLIAKANFIIKLMETDICKIIKLLYYDIIDDKYYEKYDRDTEDVKTFQEFCKEYYDNNIKTYNYVKLAKKMLNIED